MAKSRDANYVAAQDIPGLIQQLNFILPRLSDRLDKLEGIRDEFESDQGGTFAGPVAATSMTIADDNETTIHSLGDDDSN